jgi:hypothetical protein
MSGADIKELREQLSRIEAAVANPTPPPVTVGVQGAMEITGHRSPSAFYRWASDNALYPCAPGRFLVDQIKLALTRATLRASKASQGRARA